MNKYLGDKLMQIIFENNEIIVSVNSSGEVFVKNNKSEKIIRISNIDSELRIMAEGNFHFVPTFTGGKAGFRTGPSY